MRQIYYSVIAILFILPFKLNAQNNILKKGSVIFKLDNSRNENEPVETAWVILDKYDLTGAGFIKQKFDVTDNKIALENLPVGKYYADIYVKGFYGEHFSCIIKVTKKEKIYAFKLSEVGFYNANTSLIPTESDDYSRTSVVFMK